MTVNHVIADVRRFDDPQPLKQGAWCSPRLTVAVWRLNPGQRITAHRHPHGDDVIVVMSGSGEYLYFDGTQPDPSAQYRPHPQRVVVPPPARSADDGALRIAVGPGSVVAVGQGAFHCLLNTGSEQLVAAAVTGPDTSESVYVTR